jgi:hypothetical protein
MTRALFWTAIAFLVMPTVSYAVTSCKVHVNSKTGVIDVRGQRPGLRADPERARLAVTKAIGAAQVRIEGVRSELGRHLQATVRRGYFCSYSPDPRRVPRWRT